MASCSYIKEYGLATVSEYGISVNTLLTWPDNKRAAEKAFLGARYSRSLSSLVELCTEFRDSGKDASERLDNIFHNYGHQSVGDMAEIMVYLENIPMYAALKIFNIVPTYAGQESSTRYIDFGSAKYFNSDNELYKEIMEGWFALYHKYKNPFEAYVKQEYFAGKKKINKSVLNCAVFDNLRYFLPIGSNTNIALSTSARNLARLIGELRASTYTADNQIAMLLLSLLTKQVEELPDELKEIPTQLEEQGYTTEAAELIRHSAPNYTQSNIIKEALALINRHSNVFNYSNITKLNEATTLEKPFLDLLGIVDSAVSYKEINDVINKYSCNYYDELGNLFQQGFVNIEGYMDLGSLRDMNRHRSAERFIPYLYEEWNVEHYVHNNPIFYIPPMILDPELRQSISNDYLIQLDKIKQLENKELIKYSLPLGFGVKYNFGFSISDLYYIGKLRSKLGGHIAYRRKAKEWLDLVRHIVDIPIKDEPTMEGKLSEVEVLSRG